MRIGFDAKRAYLSASGLGCYSRNLIKALGRFYPGHDLYLYTSRAKDDLMKLRGSQYYPREPDGVFNNLFPGYWRLQNIAADLQHDSIDLFHGLSNELPFSLKRKEIKSVVTIHDLIFIHHPQYYKPQDREMYLRKTRKSCQNADRIVAVSEQTKNDLSEYFNLSPNLIDVVYQGCNQSFTHVVNEDACNRLKEIYSLPSEYLLYVGKIEKRKNLLGLLKALSQSKTDVPLVVVGKPTQYIKQVKQFILKNKMANVFFLMNVPEEHLPGLYQMANSVVFPSLYEGFGIPVVEGLCSRVPVISSNLGSLQEAGGDAAYYIDPQNTEQLSFAIDEVIHDENLRSDMVNKGIEYVQQFSLANMAQGMMKVYEKSFRL